MRADHAQSVLVFELANRAYFAASISDRGDDYFRRFTVLFDELLAAQEAGEGAYYLLVAADGSVVGRFNLEFSGDGTAKLGYRVAEHAAGQGVATATVQEICRLASEQHGVRVLRAATSLSNVASQRVLLKSGFVPVGPADPRDVGGKLGTWYERELVPPGGTS
ncbi:MAG TPA: GNAT family N-acetyltransferase [Mycobacteriales bacterium]|nr:GNAT family N-acetyltransferase [Mycobacteriales bacterium]